MKKANTVTIGRPPCSQPSVTILTPYASTMELTPGVVVFAIMDNQSVQYASKGAIYLVPFAEVNI